MDDLTEARIEYWLTYHPATGTQGERYGKVNELSKQFARLILEVAPRGPERDAALHALRRLRMDVNLCIACEDAP